MKVKDIHPGAKYVVCGGAKREEVLAGEAGRIVEVVAIGSYSWLPGECGRREIIEVPERSETRVWVRWTATVTVGKAEKDVEQNNLYETRDVLMPEREWKAKHRAFLAEKRRIEQAVKAHDAAKKKCRAGIARLLGISGKSEKFSISTRWVYKSNEYVPVVSIDPELLNGVLRNGKGPKVADAIDELLALEAKSKDEITC